MAIRRWLVLTAWVMALVMIPMATPAAAQAAQEVDARLERIRAELPGVAVQRIEAQLQQAMERGLPIDPLLDKAVEGVAKRVPGERIVGAVAQLTTQLGQARDLLGNGVAPPAVDVTAIADALRRGVPEHAVRRIATRAAADEPVALEVHTVGDLMDQGVPVEEALLAVEAWRGRGGEVRELRELPAAVQRLIRQGALPAHAAAAVTGAMRGMGPGGRPGHPGMGPGDGPGAGGPPVPPGTGPPDDRGKGKSGTGGPPGGGPSGGG